MNILSRAAAILVHSAKYDTVGLTAHSIY